MKAATKAEMRDAFATIASMAKSNAIAAHARGHTESERQWLDVLAVIERVES